MEEGFAPLYNPEGFLHYQLHGTGSVKIVLHFGLLGSLLGWKSFVLYLIY